MCGCSCNCCRCCGCCNTPPSCGPIFKQPHVYTQPQTGYPIGTGGTSVSPKSPPYLVMNGGHY